jgi:elongation factor P--(R)-beta-lysine ligase
MTDAPLEEWRPSATREALQHRARLLERTREFFAARGVLEVDTPILVRSPVSDVHLHCAQVSLHGSATPLYLHTSPEYAMKRLLAAGSGDIYQICHVVRALERSPLHNAEFTLIEWYRLGFSLEQLMGEVEALARALLAGPGATLAAERVSYAAAFERVLRLDPFTASIEELASLARELGYAPRGHPDRDELLDLLMAVRVGPQLGQGALTFVYGYPASQAALARLDAADPRRARRFELYCAGIELANGFEELTEATEQRRRFERDCAQRASRHAPVPALDERLLAALAAGLPECAGVALGFDRLLMLARGARHIDEVLAFPIERS